MILLLIINMRSVTFFDLISTVIISKVFISILVVSHFNAGIMLMVIVLSAVRLNVEVPNLFKFIIYLRDYSELWPVL
jgi:hypothetical protein